MTNNGKNIGIKIPESTIKQALENRGIKDAVGIVADVVTGMQDKISKKIGTSENSKK